MHHEGDEISDAGFLDFFYRQMRPNQTGNHPDFLFFSPCECDRNFIRAADTPVVFHRLVESAGNSSEICLQYAASLRAPFAPAELRFSPDGILYHPAPVGKYGRLAPAAVMELAENISAFGEYYAITLNGVTDVVEPLDPSEQLRVLRPREGNMCVCCGAANPDGFRLSFLYDGCGKTARTWLTPDARMAGSLGIMHGGYVSLLLDEVMGKVLSGMGVKAPTARLDVQFRRPVPLGEEIALSGRLIGASGRKFTLAGEIRSAGGTILAESQALFIARAEAAVAAGAG